MDRVCKAIVDQKKKATGKKNGLRFNSDLVRLALTSYLRSKKGYKELQEKSIEVLPSPQTMARLKKDLMCEEGHCPKVYGLARDEHSLLTRPITTCVSQSEDSSLLQEFCLRCPRVFDQSTCLISIPTKVGSKLNLGSFVMVVTILPTRFQAVLSQV